MRAIWVSEAYRMLKHALSEKLHGVQRYSGHADEICEKIIEACWNKEKGYYQVSTGHFNEFYTRDMAWCARPLVNLGHRDRVRQTLSYALDRFSSMGAVATSISPKGKPFDFPRFAVDSLPCLMRSLRIASAQDLVKKHKSFLSSEIGRFYELVFDKHSGMVRKDRVFSSARDHSIRKSSCYDNCMLAMLSADLKKLGFQNPFALHNYNEIITENFWNGSAFIDDLSGDDRVSGDANVFPFWCGAVIEKEIMGKSMEAMRQLGLDRPFPLRYGVTHPELNFADILVPNYERDTVWTYLGLLFIDIVSQLDAGLARDYLSKYTEVIEKNGNVLELFDKEGNPFRTVFYHSDRSMLWGAIYLDLKRRLK
jgi:hypothetical protein